ncbi:hypothetical protein, partial [Raoultella ornithinolytica]|uniref:hypothetical protein n=1 Tax=Raoultella ornithinolytica TaxID=54291 RepID=UPI00186B47D8
EQTAMASFKYLIFVSLAVLSAYSVAAAEDAPKPEERAAEDGARVKKNAYIAAGPAPVLAYSAAPAAAYPYAYSAYPGYPYAYSAAYPAAYTAAYPAAYP